ncbi:hypothetical protein HZS_1439, partial [Henneguya salminicola]
MLIEIIKIVVYFAIKSLFVAMIIGWFTYPGWFQFIDESGQLRRLTLISEITNGSWTFITNLSVWHIVLLTGVFCFICSLVVEIFVVAINLIIPKFIRTAFFSSIFNCVSSILVTIFGFVTLFKYKGRSSAQGTSDVNIIKEHIEKSLWVYLNILMLILS